MSSSQAVREPDSTGKGSGMIVVVNTYITVDWSEQESEGPDLMSSRQWCFRITAELDPVGSPTTKSAGKDEEYVALSLSLSASYWDASDVEKFRVTM